MTPRNTILFIFLALLSLASAAPELERFGIGTVLRAGDGITGPRIMEIMRDSPAAKGKLARGMIITKVDDTETAGLKLEQCVERISGAQGTSVRIEATDPSDGKTISVKLTREKVAFDRKDQ